MSSAGSKIQDTEQQYQYSVPYITPSGHEVSFYDTPKNERVVIKHTSGSHIEFKPDGSVFIKAVKDIHTNSSILSDQAGNSGGADNTTNKIGTDHTIEVKGRLKIKCLSLTLRLVLLVVSMRVRPFCKTISKPRPTNRLLSKARSPFIWTPRNCESVLLVVPQIGTVEDGSKGGANIVKVHGHAIIQNDDSKVVSLLPPKVT